MRYPLLSKALDFAFQKQEGADRFSYLETGVSPWSRGDNTFRSLYAALSWPVCTGVLTAHQVY